MYCPNCGKKISANTKFCPYCGIKIKPNQQISQHQSGYKMPPNSVKSAQSLPASHQHSHKKIVWIILAAIIIIFAAGFGYHKYKQYKQSPVSVDLATTMPGHYWKSRKNFWIGNIEKSYFSKNSNDGIPVSYGKNYFELHNGNSIEKYHLTKVHGNTFYFDQIKTKGDPGDFSGNTYIGNGIKAVRHGNKITTIFNPGTKHKSYGTLSIQQMLHSQSINEKIIAIYLSHKQFKMIKE